MNTVYELALSFPQLLVFVQFLFRVTGIIFTAPLFGSRNVTPIAKIGLSFFIALIAFLPVQEQIGQIPLPEDMFNLTLLIAKELLFGVLVGFIALLVFVAVQFAGQIIGINIGFAVANIYDPLTQGQVSIVANLYYFLAVMIFLAINGHHFFLQAIFTSFEVLPLGGLTIPAHLMDFLIENSGKVFSMAIQIGGPIMAANFVTNAALGIIARTVPQMNIFAVGFPLKICVGLVIISFVLPMLGAILTQFFGDLAKNLNAIFVLFE